ncbi:MAG TPA: hypothetical protein VHV30_14780 [Polyangiaceae bacterium]|jgi:hypothetical protein|nr:hypothetical protein [Polyangiaceae bacterium]
MSALPSRSGWLRSVVGGCSLALASACGGGDAAQPPTAVPAPAAPPEASSAPPATGGDAAPAATASSGHLPTACADPSASICAPPGDFVERLCAKPLQDVALALFAKDTPFTRLYMKGKIDELAFDEEVLALRFRGQPKGGMIIGSGAGTYDLLRWDGTCSRGVEAEVVGKTRPPRPRSAHVQWHRISAGYQDALVAGSDAIKKAHAKRGKECQGAMSGDVSRACEGADQALVDAVVDFVRTHGGLPEPSTIP